ncbi:MAG: DUF3256 family protein [Tannerella sp.]|jgi:hypothetical protein|nr:DUF3256 family protein [Tannerella sp.]
MRYLFFLLLYIWTLPVLKAQDMAAFFISMPNENILQLEEAWRKDLVDLYRSGKPATLDNTMQGRSTLLKLTPDYLLLQSTERSTVEIKFLPLINNTFIACVITTVSAPVADSRVEFFTTDWKPLDASGIWSPATADRFVKENADKQDADFRDAVSSLDITLIHYRLNVDDATLTAEYTTPAYLSLEDREMVKPFLKESPIVYQWKTGRFENENNLP